MLISCQSCYRVRVVSRVVTRFATPSSNMWGSKKTYTYCKWWWRIRSGGMLVTGLSSETQVVWQHRHQMLILRCIECLQEVSNLTSCLTIVLFHWISKINLSRNLINYQILRLLFLFISWSISMQLVTFFNGMTTEITMCAEWPFFLGKSVISKFLGIVISN